jgi:signal transduction histidine kinase
MTTGCLVAAGSAVLAVLLATLAYRLRVRQISRSMNARFEERFAERTRAAREFHDAFLQTVQGSKLVADHALRDTTDHPRMVRAIEQLSVWLARATDEGRVALNSLSASTAEANDLAEASPHSPLPKNVG